MEAKELLTKRQIEKLAAPYSEEELSIGLWWDDREYDVFVSHASEDKEFIKKVLLFLKHSKGVTDAYVDWQDPDMQHETDAQTAVDLKIRIGRARKIIYVATAKSLSSVWCSWEIGYADCEKGVENVAILAILPNNRRFKKNEYLQQYPWIYYDTDEHLFMVAKPGGDRVTLYHWLKEGK